MVNSTEPIVDIAETCGRDFVSSSEKNSLEHHPSNAGVEAMVTDFYICANISPLQETTAALSSSSFSVRKRRSSPLESNEYHYKLNNDTHHHRRSRSHYRTEELTLINLDDIQQDIAAAGTSSKRSRSQAAETFSECSSDSLVTINVSCSPFNDAATVCSFDTADIYSSTILTSAKRRRSSPSCSTSSSSLALTASDGGLTSDKASNLSDDTIPLNVAPRPTSSNSRFREHDRQYSDSTHSQSSGYCHASSPSKPISMEIDGYTDKFGRDIQPILDAKNSHLDGDLNSSGRRKSYVETRYVEPFQLSNHRTDLPSPSYLASSKKNKRRYLDLPLEWWERSPRCKAAKSNHMRKIDRLIARERLVLLTTLWDRDIALEPNMFPYDTPIGIEHYTLWSKKDMSHEEILSFVDRWLSKHFPQVRRWQYDDNSGERSIELFHVHVYIEMKPFSFTPLPGYEYRPPHCGNHLADIAGIIADDKAATLEEERQQSNSEFLTAESIAEAKNVFRFSS